MSVTFIFRYIWYVSTPSGLEGGGNENKIKILQSLGSLLSSSSEMKEEFHTLGGVEIILKY